jgi:hypothetical protein
MDEKGIMRKMYKTPNFSKKLYQKRHVMLATLSNAALAMMLQTQQKTFIVGNDLRTDPYLCVVRPRYAPKRRYPRRHSVECEAARLIGKVQVFLPAKGSSIASSVSVSYAPGSTWYGSVL